MYIVRRGKGNISIVAMEPPFYYIELEREHREAALINKEPRPLLKGGKKEKNEGDVSVCFCYVKI